MATERQIGTQGRVTETATEPTVVSLTNEQAQELNHNLGSILGRRKSSLITAKDLVRSEDGASIFYDSEKKWPDPFGGVVNKDAFVEIVRLQGREDHNPIGHVITVSNHNGGGVSFGLNVDNSLRFANKLRIGKLPEEQMVGFLGHILERLGEAEQNRKLQQQESRAATAASSADVFPAR